MTMLFSLIGKSYYKPSLICSKLENKQTNKNLRDLESTKWPEYRYAQPGTTQPLHNQLWSNFTPIPAAMNCWYHF